MKSASDLSWVASVEMYGRKVNKAEICWSVAQQPENHHQHLINCHFRGHRCQPCQVRSHQEKKLYLCQKSSMPCSYIKGSSTNLLLTFLQLMHDCLSTSGWPSHTTQRAPRLRRPVLHPLSPHFPGEHLLKMLPSEGVDFWASGIRFPCPNSLPSEFAHVF